MKEKTSVVSVVIGEPSIDKPNGVLRYCHDLDELLARSQHYKHTFLAIKKRDFFDPFFILPKLHLIKNIISLRSQPVIILHGPFHLIFLGIIMVCRKVNIGLMPHGSFHPIALKKNRIIKKLFLALSKPLFASFRVKIVGLSEAEIIDSEKLLATNQTALIFGPVINRKEMMGLQDLNLDVPTELEILYIGRLDIKTKGLDTLIETAKLLKNKPIKFLIRGPQSGEGHIWLKEKIIKYNLEKRVELSGSVFGENKIELLKNASLFILLSRNEGIPVSVLEALSYGCPCLVTRETNVPHFECDPSPVVIVERTPALVAAEIIDLLVKSDLLPEMKCEALKIYNENFSTSSTLLRIENQLNLLALT